MGRPKIAAGTLDDSRGSLRPQYLRDLQLKLTPLSSLKPYAHNPRTHSPKQIRQIADSIRTFGFINPILTDDDNGVIAGHGRIEAAKLLGLDRVPTIRFADLSPAQKRAYILADNKLAENAGWDKELLASELQYLCDFDIEFDITVTGFETAEIDLLLDAPKSDDADEADGIVAAQSVVTHVGDLWLLGEHRLLCADATQPDSFTMLMDRARAQMVFTDPPYNVPINGHVSGLGATKHREFAMARGEMSEGEFITFLGTVLRQLASHSSDGAIHFICMDWRHCFELMSAGRGVYAEFKNLCVWNKDNGGMGSLYRSKHELVFVFKHGTAPHINNIELGRHGRNRTNVWDYPGANSLHSERQEMIAMHPTVKPRAMVADAIRDCSERGGIVLDCFGGSGVTLLAAEQTGRRGYLMELDPAYVDLTIRRFQKVAGVPAKHAASGRTFDDLEHEQVVSAGLHEEGEEELVNDR